MTVSIENSFLSEKALDYAKLSDLAYAIWENGILKTDQDNYDYYSVQWNQLYNKGYRFVAYCPNDPATGYSGTIFYNSNTQTYILANRGTEGSIFPWETDPNDLKADADILNGFTPAAQFASMIKFITDTNLSAVQFDVTGHSLGGCLAQMAKATYSGNVDEVYTYNAPGAKELKQNYFFKRPSATPGMVVVEYFQGTVWIETEWKQETWDLYQTFLNNKQSVNDTKVYNILGKDWLKTIANWKPDIGGEVFINGAWHGIASVIKSLETRKYYIDSRQLMTVIGSQANELFDARYNSGHYTSTPQKITVVGGYGSDIIYGGDGGNKIFGDLPDDFVDANGESGNTIAVVGHDLIIGGAGDDTIYGGAGNDTIWGLYGDDYIVGGYDKDNIYGGSGNDSIWGGDGLNTIYGDAGNDQIVGGADKDIIYGGTGNDTIWGEGGDDKISSGAGSDTLFGGAGNDTYYIEADGSTNRIEDKQGTNLLYIGKRLIADFRWDASDSRYESRDGQVVGVKSGTDFVVTYAGTTVILNENFEWGDFGINLITLPTEFFPILGDQDSDVNDILAGTSGDDKITGLTGSDILYGGAGSDEIFVDNYGEMEALIAAGESAPAVEGRGELATGNEGDDFIYGADAADFLFGGVGMDLLVGRGGNDVIYGDSTFTDADQDWFILITDTGGGSHESCTGLGYIRATSGSDDVIYAGAGNDFVEAERGDDEIYGGIGDDTIYGDGGNDFIEGGDGNDQLVGDEGRYLPVSEHGADYIDGGSGDDWINGMGGSDELFGGTGNDTIYGDGLEDLDLRIGDDYLDGEEGDDILFGNNGNDEIFGGEDNDQLYGDAGDDYLDGEDGVDSLYGGAGNDNMFGGDGNDYMEGDDTNVAGNDYLDGEAGDDTIIGAGGADIIYGGDGNDQLHGDAANVALADQGNDYIDGEDGDDLISGYGGNDQLYGGSGNDSIAGGVGEDYIDGGDGNNEILGGEGDDEIYAGSGNDWLQGDKGNDYLDGGAGNNTLLGGEGNDTLFGGEGDDQLYGDSGDLALIDQGDDYIYGEGGNDQIAGYSGNDYLDGGIGDDSIWGMEGKDQIYGGEGNDQLSGDMGNDYLEGDTGKDSIWGGLGNDTIYGGAGDDILYDEGGNTVIYGGEGNDWLQVTNGNNYLDGGAGDDTVISGTGNDILVGGDGNDIYYFATGSGTDVINNYAGDYKTTTDILQFDTGITSSDLEFVESGNDLRINIIGTTDSVTISNWFKGYAYTPDQIIFSDSPFMTPEQINTLISTAVYGTSDDEVIVGGDGSDIIYSGTGNDTLAGGAGNDTYVFNLGDGSKTIDDSASDTESNTLLFGAGITPDNLQLTIGSSGSLDILIGDNGDVIHFNNFNPDDVYGTRAIDTYEFADETVLSYSELVNRGIGIFGTSGDDQINGTNGFDQIMGLEGNDTINSGAGNDTLIGGDGNDTFIFNFGDGAKTIVDYSAGNDTLVFGSGITPGMIRLALNIGTLQTVTTNADGSTLTSTIVYNGEGGYTETWSSNNGQSGERTLSDDGSTLQSVTTNADGSTLTSTTVYYATGGYHETWSSSNGLSGENDKYADGSILMRVDNPDGSSTIRKFEADGSKPYEERIYTTSTGQVTIDVSGYGDVINVNNAIINLAADSQATVNGSNNTFNVGDNSNLAVNTTFNGELISIGQIGLNATINATYTCVDDENNSYTVTNSTSTDSSGARTDDYKKFNPNGSPSFETITRTSADGNTLETIRFIGGGVKISSEETIIQPDGARTYDHKIFKNDGSLFSETITDTSADGNTIDAVFINGDGSITGIQHTEIDTTGARINDYQAFKSDGTLWWEIIANISADSNTIDTTFLNGDCIITGTAHIQYDSFGAMIEDYKAFHPDGSLSYEKITNTSADGKTIDAIYLNADGITTGTEQIRYDSTGAKIDNCKQFNSDGSLSSETITVTSADGNTIDTTFLNGDGITTGTEQIKIDSTGAKTDDYKYFNTDGSLSSETITNTSADGRTIEITHLHADGITTETERIKVDSFGNSTNDYKQFYPDGSLMSEIITVKDSESITMSIDQIQIDSSGFKTDDYKQFNSDGSLSYETITTTSADGRTIEVTHINADGITTETERIQIDSLGAKTEDYKLFNTDGSLSSETITNTSADGKAIDITYLNAEGIITATEQIRIDSLGVKTDDYKLFNTDGSLSSEFIIKTNSDNKTLSIDQIQIDSSGVKTEDYTQLNSDGSLLSEIITITSADGKTIDITYLNADSIITATDQIQIDSLGAKIEDYKLFNSDGSLSSETITDTSADGKNIDITYLNADGIITATEQIMIDPLGAKTEDYKQFNPDGSLLSETITNTSADGNTITITTNGSTLIKVINPDGSSTTEKFNSDGSLQYRENTYITATGQVIIDVSGQGDVIDTDNAIINLASDSQATVNGSKNIFNVEDNVELTVNEVIDLNENSGPFDYGVSFIEYYGDIFYPINQTGKNDTITVTFNNVDSGLTELITTDSNGTETTCIQMFDSSGALDGSANISVSPFLNGAKTMTIFYDDGTSMSGTITGSKSIDSVGSKIIDLKFAGSDGTQEVLQELYLSKSADGNTIYEKIYESNDEESRIQEIYVEKDPLTGVCIVDFKVEMQQDGITVGSMEEIFKGDPNNIGQGEIDGQLLYTKRYTVYADGGTYLEEISYSYSSEGSLTGMAQDVKIFDHGTLLQEFIYNMNTGGITGDMITYDGNGGYFKTHISPTVPSDSGDEQTTVTSSPGYSESCTYDVEIVDNNKGDYWLITTDPDGNKHSQYLGHDDSFIIDTQYGFVVSTEDVTSDYLAAVAEQTVGADSTALEGAKWNRNVITWSIADNPGTLVAPFSNYMSNSYEVAIQNAFNYWSDETELIFEEVPDSALSDIRIGWGKFDTAASGEIGCTSYQINNAQFLPGVIIRLEDPTEYALINETGGQLTYAGTETDFSQVLIHEIGHALGLADSKDPNSVMYCTLGANNKSLTADDLQAIQALYASNSLLASLQTLDNAINTQDSTFSIAGLTFNQNAIQSQLNDQINELIFEITGTRSNDNQIIFPEIDLNNIYGLNTINNFASTQSGTSFSYSQTQVAGTTSSDMSSDGNSLVINYGNNGDTINLQDYYQNENNGSLDVGTLQFADGSQMSITVIPSQPQNNAPVVANPLQDQTATEDAVFSFTVSADTFKDVDAGDILTYNATGMPGWLHFDANTRTFSGTPLNGDVNTESVTVTATDTSNTSVSEDFNLTVNNVNDAPTVANPIPNQTTPEDEPFSFTVPADTFADIDVGDTLTYSATLSDGSALPSWLNFNTATMTFSGTPINDNIGMLSIKVTATDLAGASVSDDFDLTVNNVNDTPTVANPVQNQTATEDASFSFTVPANTFNDIDTGDSLTYSATMPSWLSFDAATRTFSGIPSNDNVGTQTVTVTVIDTSDARVTDSFDITVSSVNDAPTIANSIQNQSATEDAAFTFAVPSNTFNDLDAGDSLTYGATLADGSVLPSWITFDAVTRTFSGTPANENVGDLSVMVTATDMSGASISTNFNITVINVNDTPVVGNPITDQTINKCAPYSYTIPATTFSDIDAGDTLTYSATLADGSVLPSWLNFNSATRTFSGTPTCTGKISVKVTATDGSNASVSSSFNLDVRRITYGTNCWDFVVTGYDNDLIYALNGIDTVYSDNGDDVIYGGNDTDYLFGEGNNDIIYGESGNDYLDGGSGNDTLNGGTGADIIIGGSGDDTYVIDNTGDEVVEYLFQGTDTVQSSVTYSLGNNVENLALTGSNAVNGTGNSLNNVLTGNNVVNTLVGNSGNDTLDGGQGDDILTGGSGSDTYLFRRNDGKDTLNETAGVSGDSDTLKLTDGITTTEPVLVKQGNDLYVFIDANNYVKIASEFQTANYGIERLEVSDGHYITRNDIQTIVDTMNYINNDSGMDVLQKYNAMLNEEQYQNILATSWHQ